MNSKYFFVFFIITIHAVSYGQFKYGKTLQDSVILAVHSKEDLLYAGIDNQLQINKIKNDTIQK